MSDLRDVFTETPEPEIEVEPMKVESTPPEEVEARFQLLESRRLAAHRAAISRANASTARAVAQSFSEYGRAFHKVAATKGSTVDHAVALFLAVTCDEQAEHYSEMQAHCTTIVDREGSL